MTNNESGETLIDPDPFSLLLMILGATGSIASLVSLYDEKRRATQADIDDSYFLVRDTVTGIEVALNDLASLTYNLEIVSYAGASRRGRPAAPQNQIAGFGRLTLLFTGSGYEQWAELQVSVLDAAGRVQRHMNTLLKLFATTRFYLPRDIGEELSSVVSSLNEVASRLAQMHYADLFQMLGDAILRCRGVLRRMRLELDEILLNR